MACPIDAPPARVHPVDDASPDFADPGAAPADGPIADDPEPDRGPDRERAEAYRRRLLDGLQASIEERGLIDTTVADIVRHAHTSRRTFYEHFTDRSECFQVLVQRHTDLTWQAVLAAVDPTATPQVQMASGIAAMCESLTARPALTVSSVRDLPSLSPAARAMQRRLLDSTADMLVALADTAHRRDDGRTDAERRLLARLAFGGMREIIACTIEDGEDLQSKANEIADAVLRVLDLTA